MYIRRTVFKSTVLLFKMAIIYLIVNPKGKIYVGQTNNLYNRLKSHKSSAKSNKNIILYHSIRKYGWENHVVSILEEIDYELKDAREIFWIKELNSFCGLNKMGMNMSLGGAQGNPYSWKHDKVRVEKARLRMLGENNHSYGVKQTEANKKIIGDKARVRNLANGKVVPKWGAEKGQAKTRKKILFYDKEGVFKMEFISLSSAAKFLNIDRKAITSVLCNQQSHTAGFIFKYYEENYPLVIDVSFFKFKMMSIPVYLVSTTKEIIKEYKSAVEASEDLGILPKNINRAAKDYNGKPLRSGHIFFYKDDYEKQILNQVINN